MTSLDEPQDFYSSFVTQIYNNQAHVV